MRNIIIIYGLLLSFLLSKEENSKPAWSIDNVNQETTDQDAKDQMWMMQVSQAHWKGDQTISQEELNKIEKIFKNTTGRTKIQALGILITIEELSDWAPKLEKTLYSDHKIEASQSLLMIELKLKKGSDEEKVALYNQGLLNRLDGVRSKFPNDDFIKEKADSIQEMIKTLPKELPTSQIRLEKPILDTKELERLKAQGEQITEAQSTSEEAQPKSFPWWLLGIVGLIVVLGFMLLKGKSK